jgi:uncharacterized membrane protein
LARRLAIGEDFVPRRLGAPVRSCIYDRRGSEAAVANAGGRRKAAAGAAAAGSSLPRRADASPQDRESPFRRYTPLYSAFLLGVVCVALALMFQRDFWVEAGVVGFFATYLVMILVRLPRLTPRHLRAHADESDTPGYVILVVALAIVIAALVSLFLLLNGGSPPGRPRVALGVLTLVLSWLGLHAMLAFHYAYEYYGSDMTSPPGRDGHRPHVGGLTFPGSEQPDALSFLYFSFVVAMTAQVSDVTVTSNAMRRLVLLHGILAFLFNTVILAIAVNVVVSLGH